MASTVHGVTGFSSETGRIADQLRRAYKGPAWHGPPLKGILLDVTPEQAREKPVSGAHSIWEIVLHITAWMRIARERITAGEARQVSDEEDWPQPDGSWESALQDLEHEERLLYEAILSFPEARLHERAPASEPQTYYVLLHGVVQHTLYHAGQIVILGKQDFRPLARTALT